MQEITIREANARDMDEIMEILIAVFTGEQKIPAELNPISEEKNPQWWCAVSDAVIVGVVAGWQEDGETHWGRFAIRPEYRGLHIGTKLAKHSLNELFAQGAENICLGARDATVKIICAMGGKVTGEGFPFYEGTVTPMVFSKSAFSHK